MPFSQIKDILNAAIQFHKVVEDFYLKVKVISEKESVKVLVDYMARHEKILEEELGKVTLEQQEEITKEWLKYEPSFNAQCCIDELKIDKDTSVDEIIDAGLKLNQCLIDYYHEISEIAPTPEIKELFSNLEIMEIAEKKKLARVRGM